MKPMTPAEHYDEAARLLAIGTEMNVARAQVHATLALYRPPVTVVLDDFVPPQRPSYVMPAGSVLPSQADGTLDFDPTVAAGLRELDKAELDGAAAELTRWESLPALTPADVAELADAPCPATNHSACTDPTTCAHAGIRATFPELVAEPKHWRDKEGDLWQEYGALLFLVLPEGTIDQHGGKGREYVEKYFGPLTLAEPAPVRVSDERVAEIRCDQIANTLNQPRSNNATQTEIDEYIRALPEFGRVEREDICDEIRVFDLADGTRFIKAAGKSYSEPTWKWSR